jgi:LysM repeat protein
MKFGLLILGILWFSSCSPLRSSPNDEKHQLELTLHEVQTSLDDIKHDINCFQTELQILDGRIKYFENALASLKQQDLEKQQFKIDQISQSIQSLEKKWTAFEKEHQAEAKDLQSLTSHADETVAALTQFKERIGELEQELFSQNRKFNELAKKPLIYKVKPGDSLEKIAKAHKTAVEKIKKLNHLDQDLIVVGQELKIPAE